MYDTSLAAMKNPPLSIFACLLTQPTKNVYIYYIY